MKATQYSSSRNPVLLGNAFPLTLVRRPVSIVPESVERLRTLLARDGIASFWGHANTQSHASKLLGVDVAPSTTRPALQLSADKLPRLGTQIFRSCWILSPDYVAGYRPAVGEEVSPEKIIGWQVLRLDWIVDGEGRRKD